MERKLEEVFESLRPRFKSTQVHKQTTYYLSLGDRDDEKWTLTLTPTSCDIAQGKVARADCVLKMSRDLFIKMVLGKHRPSVADFVMGKIKTNDFLLLKRLQDSFGL